MVEMRAKLDLLETHIVDGQENALGPIESKKRDEVQKYCSLTDHVFVGYRVLANPEAFNELPKDMQDLVSSTIDEGALKQREEKAREEGGIGLFWPPFGIGFYQIGAHRKIDHRSGHRAAVPVLGKCCGRARFGGCGPVALEWLSPLTSTS